MTLKQLGYRASLGLATVFCASSAVAWAVSYYGVAWSSLSAGHYRMICLSRGVGTWQTLQLNGSSDASMALPQRDVRASKTYFGHIPSRLSPLSNPWTPSSMSSSRLKSLSVPLYLPTILVGLPLAIVVRFQIVKRKQRQKGFCVQCGYPHFGNRSGICPECGTPIPVDQKQSIA
jgi:hypothetical protein